MILNAVDRCSEGLRERALAEGWWQEGTVFNWAQVIGGAATGSLGYFSLAATVFLVQSKFAVHCVFLKIFYILSQTMLDKGVVFVEYI
jgi:hypothetical protein